MINKYEDCVITHNVIKESFRKRRLLKEDELDNQLGLGDSATDEEPQDGEPSQTDEPTDDQTDLPNDDSMGDEDVATDEPSSTDVPPTDPTATNDDTETIDITDLVTNQNNMLQTLETLLGKLDGLEKNQKATVQTVVKAETSQTDRLDLELQELRKEIEKRNPTKEEQMMLNSMNMYPYNVKLSDYFKPTTDMSVRYSNANTKPEASNGLKDTLGVQNEAEYVLRQGDINKNPTFNAKKTFDYFA